MRIFIPDMDQFFAWMDENGFAYVVLRGYEGYLQGYPPVGGKQDVDLLIEDRAVDAVCRKYASVTKNRGVKCDVYSVTTGHDADFLGHAYYPAPLAEKLLRDRQRYHDRFFVPGDEDYFYSLLYHIAYHKAETSGISYEYRPEAEGNKYFPVLSGLAARLGVELEFSLRGFNELLAARGYRLAYETLCSYLYNDFSRHRKSYLYAVLADQYPGELNLFVIRRVAVKAGLHGHLIEELAKKYTIITVKNIPWQFRLFKSGSMRGGKWKRGGKPYLAVVVFDPNPVPSDEENRQIHPFVFNSNQFIKRDLREWFVAKASVRDKDNALHSTDNEAEAIGHFPLFFSPEERQAIFTQLARLRGELPGAPTPSPAGPRP
jgi:hypothetical protein